MSIIITIFDKIKSKVRRRYFWCLAPKPVMHYNVGEKRSDHRRRPRSAGRPVCMLRKGIHPMKKNKVKRHGSLRRVLGDIRLSLLAFFVLVCLVLFGVLMIRRSLLKNAQESGSALARSYAEEARSNLTVYETLLSYGTAFLEDRLNTGYTKEELFASAEMYFDRMTGVLGDLVISPFLFLDGEMLTTTELAPSDIDPDYDPTQRPWYQAAVEADGTIVFTGLYTDIVSGQPAITVVQSINNGYAVMGFDIFTENFHFQADPLSLAHADSFFLCDAAGSVLYARTGLPLGDAELQDYCNFLLDKISAGELGEYNDYITDLDGNRRGVYYARMDNGWYTIVTVPYHTILGDLKPFGSVSALILAISLLVLAVTVWRAKKYHDRIGRANETVQVLGNSYYALYRVDCSDGTYEMIKSAPPVQGRLAEKGSYADLLQMVQDVMEPGTYTEFRESFSLENIRRLIRNHTPDFGGDFQRRFGDEYRWVNVRVLFDETLPPEEVVLCFREIGQERQRQMEERRVLEDALELARRNETAKQTFFSSMSHDMRTPLNAIVGLSELSAQYEDTDRLKDCLRKINNASRQLLNLINDILDMSRMEQGKVMLNNREFDLRECLEECLDAFRFQAQAQQKTFDVGLELNNTHLLGDPARISQILNNLLSNAFKFTPEGGTIRFHVSQIDKGDFAKYKIVVADTGIGMSADFLPHLFEPYSREMRFTAKQSVGTGLGMSITKNLVSQMNGELQVESEQGKGTTFTLVLPFAVVADSEPHAEAAPAAESYSLEGRRILLAEDNEVNMEIATELLQMHGVEVTQAWTGREALEQFEKSEPFHFDAVLMDMQMPEMDGCEAARRIRALDRPDAGTVPIIAVTANAFSEDIAATAAAGMNAHVSKPIDFAHLCRTLARLTAGTEPSAPHS